MSAAFHERFSRQVRPGDLVSTRMPDGSASQSGTFHLYPDEQPHGPSPPWSMLSTPVGTLLFVINVDSGAMLVLTSSGVLGWVVVLNSFVRFDVIAGHR